MSTGIDCGERRTLRGQHSALRSSRLPCPTFLRTLLGVTLTGTALCALVPFSFAEATERVIAASEGAPNGSSSSVSGIREVIPARFRKRYQKWKEEYLSTPNGREQWERYARDRNFTLTITISEERGGEACVSEYRWGEDGGLIAATIILGSQLDKGYPDPRSYPVTSSLSHVRSSADVGGSLLAATKMAHEFGHVNMTAKTGAKLYQLQDSLIPAYNKLLFANGRNIRDPRLVEMALQMGGTPVEIRRDRELWAETNALAYLRQRCLGGDEYRPLFKAIRRAVEEYAKEHVERFR